MKRLGKGEQTNNSNDVRITFLKAAQSGAAGNPTALPIRATIDVNVRLDIRVPFRRYTAYVRPRMDIFSNELNISTPEWTLFLAA